MRKSVFMLLSVVMVYAITSTNAFAEQAKPDILVIWGDDIGQSNISHYTHGLGSTLYLVGDADIDVTAQGVRAAGKFDKNYILFLGGTARYEF